MVYGFLIPYHYCNKDSNERILMMQWGWSPSPFKDLWKGAALLGNS